MKKKSVYPYYHSWPRFKDDKIEIRVLTPLRMLIVRKLVYNPVIFFFRAGFAYFIFEGAFRIMKDQSFLMYVPHLTYEKILIYMAIVGVLMTIEITTRFKLTRMIFGMPLKITFEQDNLNVKAGRFNKSFPRSIPVNFAIKPFETQYNPLYSKSKKFQLVIDDHHSITLAEIFDLKLTDKLVENCNYANLNTGRQQNIDFDPKNFPRT